MQLVLLLLVLVAGAQSPEAPEAPADEPADPSVAESFSGGLERAKRLYFDGRHEQALEVFEELALRIEEEPGVGLVTEALLYMGEVQYQLGDTAGAWRTFEQALDVDPEVEMSPFNHPREVVHWFELVKQRVEQANIVPDPPPPPPPPPPLPVWGYAPFGLPQLGQDRTGRGLLYGGLQLAFATVSIGTFVYLDRVNGEDHPPGWSDDDVARRVNQIRWTVQWPSTVAFWATWAVSVLDGRRRWIRSHEVSVGIGVTGPDGGPSLTLGARF